MTASILFPGVSLVTDERLTERGLGEWEGKDVDEMRQRYPDAFMPSGKLHPLFTPPGGETIAAVAGRIVCFVRQQFDADIDNFVAVTHNAVIRTLRSLIEDLPLQETFLFSEKNLQCRSYEINSRLMDKIHERREAISRMLGK